MLELLSPAGSPQAVTAAVSNGADAVYLGCGSFNARRRAKNFSPEELEAAVVYCHVRGVKVYLTLNTLVSDRELPAALEMGELANALGVDAVLVQDLGLARRLRAAFPDLPLHASTQMTVHSLDGVRFCAQMGLERVVLSRELSREAIAYICEHAPVEIEVFAHGALCMCYSGQCFLSSVLGGRSGNRGLCAQPCRLPYNGSHPLSLKDMSLAGHLRELRDMGVACVKLEGRMKRPEYVAVVTRVYAAALREDREPTQAELAQLAQAFSRDGFTQGYYLGRTGKAMFGFRSEAEPPQALYAQARESYSREVPRVDVDFRVSVRASAPVSASVSDPQGRTLQASGDPPQAALRRAVTPQELQEQFAKTGGTPYRARSVEVELDPGLSVPKSALNALRRTLLNGLTNLRAQVPPRRVAHDPPEVSSFSPSGAPAPQSPCAVPAESRPGPGQIRAGSRQSPGPVQAKSRSGPALVFTLRSPEQLTPALWALPHSRIDLPLSALRDAPDRVRQAMDQGARLSLALPRISWDKERGKLTEFLEKAGNFGIKDALIGAWDLVETARQFGLALHGDFGLGVYNSQTLNALAELGFQSATASFELKLPMLRDLEKPLPTEALAYGRLPLMMLEQPPGGAATPQLTDRFGTVFPLLEDIGNRWELLNSQPLYLADKPEWKTLGLSALRLLFTVESPEECVKIAKEYLSGGRPPRSFTRGLYYRDVE